MLTHITNNENFYLYFMSGFNDIQPIQVILTYDYFSIIVDLQINNIVIKDDESLITYNFPYKDISQATVNSVNKRLFNKDYKGLLQRLSELLIRSLEYHGLMYIECADIMDVPLHEYKKTYCVVENMFTKVWFSYEDLCLYYMDEYNTWCKINFKTIEQLKKFVGIGI